jgi:hypothetical protein
MSKFPTLAALTGALALPFFLASAPPASAQSDVSPVLLLESVPADQPGYRRMMRVHYLNGPSVSVSYKALNRSEFVQAPGTANPQAVSACASGPATTLSEIRAFQRAEAQLARRNSAPETVRFCIKGIPNWESRNKKTYLDPIFEGMPYAATLK